MADLSNRPLLGVGTDTDLYVPAPTLLTKVRRAVDSGLNVLVIGAPGAGKTTFLHMLERRLQDDDFSKPLVFVTGSFASNAIELLSYVSVELQRAIPDFRPRPVTAPGVSEPGGARLLDAVRSLRSDTGALILLDELPDRETGTALFGRLRDELWQLPHRWVVASRSDWSAALTQPPADAFFELKLTLPGLTTDQINELLWRRGVDVESLGSDLVRQIAELSGGNPLTALMSAREAVLGSGSPLSPLQDRAKRQEAAAALGRAASMLVAEMEGRGAVSASDEDLLRSLGWTRSRATQVLRELEKSQLARSYAASGSNRRLYELVANGGN